jgi:hypothetical protein
MGFIAHPPRGKSIAKPSDCYTPPNPAAKPKLSYAALNCMALRIAECSLAILEQPRFREYLLVQDSAGKYSTRIWPINHHMSAVLYASISLPDRIAGASQARMDSRLTV